jgi:excisionase family DNA binding protein
MFNYRDDELLKAQDVARILGVSKTQVYRLLATELPCVRFGGATVRVRQADLEAYINKCTDHHAENSRQK